MKLVLMLKKEALKNGIVEEPFFNRYTKKWIIVQDQDLLQMGYDLENLPKEFYAEVLSPKEMKERIKKIKGL